jgi:hypothetical protein
MSSILTPRTATPRCTAIVDLISKFQRPYLFLVTVTGEPPHAGVRKYHVIADSDNSAAMKGLELYVKEFSDPAVRLLTGTITPKAKLQ